MLLPFGYICGNAIFFQHNAVSHAFLTLRYPFARIIYSPISLQYRNIFT
nr:MAG TPA: hypothetical protein [Caudoviricetes sp.]